jgi:hypothetical protein
MHTHLNLDIARAVEAEIRRRANSPEREHVRRTRSGSGPSGATTPRRSR